ncbi:hypothetical protein XU18_2485 [Perkinsela sp. CCAP 1560/4]|nr:hypothetical protein XU18_2626 [Perkinsela sp. CCAP 1560/4]KNH06725.1 hypothetical protein XU18_2485 [Perkinsela sp. CCAP 1560/4]|eukprot:KNH06527.1 hypothetical protein XU18_2626 [Perkinsela sp. CCAP 1560/4]
MSSLPSEPLPAQVGSSDMAELDAVHAQVASSGKLGNFSTGFLCRWSQHAHPHRPMKTDSLENSLAPVRAKHVLGDRLVDQFGSNLQPHIFSAPSGMYHPRNINYLDLYDAVPPETLQIRGGSLSGLTPV